MLVYPTLREELDKQMVALIRRMNHIHKSTPEDGRLHVKDLEDLRRISETLANISIMLEKNFYLE